MKKGILFLLILLFMSSFSVINSNAEPKAVNYVVVYDEAHLQFFTHDLLKTALAGLNESFDVENEIDVTIEFEINTENFTNSNLQGADLVIIPSPNLREDKTSNVDTVSRINEESALEEFLSIGGSVLYMSNPYSANVSLAGHFLPMNNLIVDDLGFAIKLGFPSSVTDGDNVTIAIDDFNNDGNASHIYFNNNFINGGVWDQEINDISKILYYGSTIDESFTSTHYGNASALTYSVDRNYDLRVEDLNRLKWMVGNTFGENDGRGVLIGSTIMFSDLAYDNENAWIEMEDNQELFENLVAWLLNITPLNKPVDTVDSGFGYFLGRNILFSILIPIALLVIVFGTLIRTNIITADKIFSFRVKQKTTKKSKTTEGEKSTTKKKSTKKTPKKQRRKRN